MCYGKNLKKLPIGDLPTKYMAKITEKKGGYGVNIHDTKISHVQVKQRNSALIAVLHLKVTLRTSTWSKDSHLIVSSKRPLAKD